MHFPISEGVNRKDNVLFPSANVFDGEKPVHGDHGDSIAIDCHVSHVSSRGLYPDLIRGVVGPLPSAVRPNWLLPFGGAFLGWG